MKNLINKLWIGFLLLISFDRLFTYYAIKSGIGVEGNWVQNFLTYNFGLQIGLFLSWAGWIFLVFLISKLFGRIKKSYEKIIIEYLFLYFVVLSLFHILFSFNIIRFFDFWSMYLWIILFTTILFMIVRRQKILFIFLFYIVAIFGIYLLIHFKPINIDEIDIMKYLLTGSIAVVAMQTSAFLIVKNKVQDENKISRLFFLFTAYSSFLFLIAKAQWLKEWLFSVAIISFSFSSILLFYCFHSLTRLSSLFGIEKPRHPVLNLRVIIWLPIVILMILGLVFAVFS